VLDEEQPLAQHGLVEEDRAPHAAALGVEHAGQRGGGAHPAVHAHGRAFVQSVEIGVARRLEPGQSAQEPGHALAVTASVEVERRAGAGREQARDQAHGDRGQEQGRTGERGQAGERVQGAAAIPRQIGVVAGELARAHEVRALLLIEGRRVGGLRCAGFHGRYATQKDGRDPHLRTFTRRLAAGARQTRAAPDRELTNSAPRPLRGSSESRFDAVARRHTSRYRAPAFRTRISS
jgi:hypothetical protein